MSRLGKPVGGHELLRSGALAAATDLQLARRATREEAR